MALDPPLRRIRKRAPLSFSHTGLALTVFGASHGGVPSVTLVRGIIAVAVAENARITSVNGKIAILYQQDILKAHEAIECEASSQQRKTASKK